MDRTRKTHLGCCCLLCTLSCLISYLYLSSVFSQALRMITVGYDYILWVSAVFLYLSGMLVLCVSSLGHERSSKRWLGRQDSGVNCCKKISGMDVSWNSGFWGLDVKTTTSHSAFVGFPPRQESGVDSSTLWLWPAFYSSLQYVRLRTSIDCG